MSNYVLTDEQWTTYRNCADRVTVSIVPLEHPVYGDEATEAWVIVSPGAAWNVDWLVREVQALTAAASSQNDQPPGEHVLELREQHFNWGADAASYEILLFLAQWAATSAAWDATKALARKMQEKLDAKHQEVLERPLTEDEVEARARWIISARYKEPEERLMLLSVEIKLPANATAVFRAPSGWRYECDLVALGNQVVISRIKRIRRAD